MAVIDSVSDSANDFVGAVNGYAATHHDGLIALLLLASVIVAFAGRTLLTPVVFLLGFVPTTAGLGALGLALVREEHPPNARLLEAISAAVAVMGGILVGVVVLRLLFAIATFTLCAGFGAVVVLVLHLFLLSPAAGPTAMYFLYGVVALAALVAGLLSVSYPETGVILGTSFDGAAVAVYSLARFLGHQPNVLPGIIPGKDASGWWGVGYGVVTVVVGVFGTVMQRRVAAADAIVAQALRRGGLQGGGAAATGEEEPLIEPPASPPNTRSGDASPGSGYGAATDKDDAQYSVVHNLGAGPLDGGENNFKAYQGKDGNGPL